MAALCGAALCGAALCGAALCGAAMAGAASGQCECFAWLGSAAHMHTNASTAGALLSCSPTLLWLVKTLWGGMR